MKLLLLSLTLVALALCQCDSDDLKRSWASFQDGSAFTDNLWEEKELIAWGMDGNNKWNDFWLRIRNGISHYNRVTCSTTDQGALPNYVALCGDCTITTGFQQCNCYPYYDVAENYQESPVVQGANEPSEAPEGWPSAYASPNPPFEQLPEADGTGAWTLENCKQYKPAVVYYYTWRLNIHSDGEFEMSAGISKGFTITTEAWHDFCEAEFQSSTQCHVPSDAGASSNNALFGAQFQYQSGEWRANDDNDVQFFHYNFENGCHAKADDRRWPTASFCGDDSGWRFGAGTTAHVHWGCDVSTFFDTETDFDIEIDDTDCNSVYLLFDELNPLDVTVDNYGPVDLDFQPGNRFTRFDTFATLVRSGDCWYRSSWTDHRSRVPNYRTPCSASGLAVPFFALMSLVLMLVMRNI